MPQTYQQKKAHIYTWVAKNPDKHREINKISQRRYDGWKRIQKIYFNILLN